MDKRLTFLFIFCVVSMFCIAQEKVIINKAVDTLYENITQLFVIEVPKRNSAEIIIEPSQGNIASMDEGRPIAELFNIGNLKKGKVVVKVYKLNGKEKEFLGERKFIVADRPLSIEERNYSQLKPKPIITLSSKARGFILLDSLKKIRKLFISSPYKIKSATVYFGDHDVTTANLSSSDLSPLYELFRRCQNESMITFTNIKIIKGKTIYEVPDMNFIVKDK